MPAAPTPVNESLRMADLRALHILDSAPEEAFDDLTRQAMDISGTSIGLMSFIDEERQWFKSRFGVAVSETPRSQSFCAHALSTPGKPLIVADAVLDPRFADNPSVTGEPGYRFYAGFPLRSLQGRALGTLCVLDHKPRRLSTEQVDKLRALAQQASVRLSLRRDIPAERRFALSFAAGLLLLLCIALFFAVQVFRFLTSDRWVEHTHQVIQEIEHTLFEVQAAESSQRGYSASGQETYLPPYRAAVVSLPAHLATLRRMTSDNPIQQTRTTALEAAIDAKLVLMQARFEERRTLGAAALDPKYLDGRGRRAMEAVVAAGNQMIDTENTLLRQRAGGRGAELRTSVGMLFGTGIVGAGLLTASFLFIRRELRRTRTLGGELAQANLGLEGEVADRRQAQRRLSVQHAVARAAAGNVSLEKAAPSFLRSIGEHLEWEVGELWIVDPATDLMRLASRWYAEAGSPAQTAGNAGFVEVSRQWTFAGGEGLPGQVRTGGAAVWEHDLQHGSCFLQAAEAQTACLRRAFAFPLRTAGHDQVSAVMIFLSREQGAPDGELVATMDTLAGQIAQFAERCGAEASLRASQARFTAFIENTPALAYIKDPEGRMLYGNSTLLRTFKLHAEQWLGKTDADFWPEATAALRENDLKVLAGDGAVELVESVPLPDGRMSRWLSYKFPLRDEVTGRKLLAGMSIDITAREEAEENRRAREEAERASRAKSEFLSRVSHELRTPLNAILGFGQLLQLSALPERDAEALEYIVKAGKHLLELINEVLDLSRAESGELQLTLASVDAGQIALECINLVARLSEARGITCELQDFGSQTALWCDQQRLRQILLNLLSNAIKYNRVGGKVFVGGERVAGDRLRLSVRDTGFGIAPDGIGRLFMPFERLEHQRGKVEGVGLGLVISRLMSEAMGGSIGVESEVGRGSTFWVELPIHKDQTDGPAPSLPG